LHIALQRKAAFGNYSEQLHKRQHGINMIKNVNW